MKAGEPLTVTWHGTARHSKTWLPTEIPPAKGERNNATEQRRTFWRNYGGGSGPAGPVAGTRSWDGRCPWSCSPPLAMKSLQERLASCHMNPPPHLAMKQAVCAASAHLMSNKTKSGLTTDSAARHRGQRWAPSHQTLLLPSVTHARTHSAPPCCGLMNMDACSWELIAFRAAKWQL